MELALTHDEVVELLGAYALDAVNDDEAAQIRDHLDRCLRCSNELDEHYDVVGMLANTGGNAPTHIWERIAGNIDHPDESEQHPATLGTLFSFPAPVSRPAVKNARKHWLRPMGAAAVAAALIVIALLGTQVSRLDNRVGQLNAVAARQGVVQAAEAALIDPDAQVVTLDAAHTTTSLAKIVMLPSGAAFVVDSKLPTLPNDETYQLWGKVGDVLVSFGLLGNSPADVPFTVSPANPTLDFAITAEHAGGVVRSTHVPVAVSGTL